MNDLIKKTVGLFGALLLCGAAQAGTGLVIPANALPEQVRADYSREISAARVTSPKTFQAVAYVRATAGELDAKKRGRFAPIGPMLKRIGPEALWAMVELVALQDTGPDVAPSARVALQAGLLEAIGAIRDPRAAPLFDAVLSSPSTEFYVNRAAVEGLGFLNTDAAASRLISLASQPGAKQSAALAAMGWCRRTVVAEYLSEALDAATDEQTAVTIAASLGDVGNSWAWQTPAVDAKAEEKDVRRIAAEALVRAFVSKGAEVRRAASKALMVVDAPQTHQLIVAARQGVSDVAVLDALNTLSRRFENNPIR